MAEPSSIHDILTRPFPPLAVKQRKIGGGMMASYVDGTTVIRRLNEATGNNWTFTVDKHWIEGQLSYALVTLTLPGCGSRQHIGVQSTDARSGEDAVAKGAITDALKKAATLFGVGLELYGLDYEDEAPVTHQEAPGREIASVRGSNGTEQVDRSTGETVPNRGPAASEKQINYILALGKGRGYVVVGDDGLEHVHEEQTTAAVNRELKRNYASVRQISKDDAKQLLDKWAPPKDDRQSAPTPIRQAPVSEPVTDETAWTEFWGWARTHGVSGAPKFTELTQRSIQGLTPHEARVLLASTLARMPKPTGTAGNDRYTS